MDKTNQSSAPSATTAKAKPSLDVDRVDLGGCNFGSSNNYVPVKQNKPKVVSEDVQLSVSLDKDDEKPLSTLKDVEEEDGNTAPVKEVKLMDPEALVESEHFDSESSQHFTTHEFGHMPNMMLYDSLSATDRSLFFAPLLPRQFFIRNVLHREKSARKITWDELFFDLIVVAAISRVATVLKESDEGVTGSVFARFCLVIIPLFNAWSSTTMFANRLGADSFSFRTYMWTMMLIMSSLGINSKSSFAVSGPITADIFATSYIISKAVYLIGYANVFFYASKFRHTMTSTVLPNAFSAIPLIVSLFFADRNIKMALWWTAWAVELASAILPFLLFTVKQFKSKYRFALNIEHQTERMGLLTLVVLGEVVIGILWDSPNSELTVAYGATFLGLIAAISFQWIYFNVEGGHQFEHAIRRSVVTSVVWFHCHTPLHISFVAAGVGITKLIAKAASTEKKKLDPGLRVMFICSCGVALFSLFAIGLMHKHHPNEKARLHKDVRLGFRLVTSVFLIIFGATTTITDPVLLIGIVTIVLVAVVGIEEFSKLERKSYIDDSRLDDVDLVLDKNEEEIIKAHPIAAEQIRKVAHERRKHNE
ncbi:hypothetical protein HK098_006939 [Nowakowskiella sp. JEL0407]|nr:hypothetical protein HK098_006930 [Nowakowskiella sp. JEL0407]KAJ3126981.1 hypothetical protein HK098_006939 [Nowakowskiella sp. JEL0407]